MMSLEATELQQHKATSGFTRSASYRKVRSGLSGNRLTKTGQLPKLKGFKETKKP